MITWTDPELPLVQKSSAPTEPTPTQRPHWYALQTRAKHEKKVSAGLQERGVEAYAPTVREVHRWSDRSKAIDVPLFPCYTFVRGVMDSALHLKALRHPSVLHWVGCQGNPIAIPDSEMVSVLAVLRSGLPVGPHVFLRFGDRVRILGGSLEGVEGVLTGSGDNRRLIVSIDLLGKSVAVSLHNYELERAA
jgi:transcription antitermination factor NusG